LIDAPTLSGPRWIEYAYDAFICYAYTLCCASFIALLYLEIIVLHRVLGKKWTEFAREIPGRAENTIKNRWNSTTRRVQRYERQLAKGGKGKVAKKAHVENQILFRYCRSVLHEESGGQPDHSLYEFAYRSLLSIGKLPAVVAASANSGGLTYLSNGNVPSSGAGAGTTASASSASSLHFIEQKQSATAAASASSMPSTANRGVSTAEEDGDQSEAESEYAAPNPVVSGHAGAAVMSRSATGATANSRAQPVSRGSVRSNSLAVPGTYNGQSESNTNSPKLHQRPGSALGGISTSAQFVGQTQPVYAQPAPITAATATPSTRRRPSLGTAAHGDLGVATPGAVEPTSYSYQAGGSLSRPSISPAPGASNGNTLPGATASLYSIHTPLTNISLAKHQQPQQSHAHGHALQGGIFESPDVAITTTSHVQARAHGTFAQATATGAESLAGVPGYFGTQHPAATPLQGFSTQISGMTTARLAVGARPGQNGAQAHTQSQLQGQSQIHGHVGLQHPRPQSTVLGSGIGSDQTATPGPLAGGIINSPHGIITPASTALAALGSALTKTSTALRTTLSTTKPAQPVPLSRQVSANSGAGAGEGVSGTGSESQATTTSQPSVAISPISSPIPNAYVSSESYKTQLNALSRGRSPVQNTGFSGSMPSTANLTAMNSVAAAVISNSTANANGVNSATAPASLLTQMSTPGFSSSASRPTIALSTTAPMVAPAFNGVNGATTSPRSLASSQLGHQSYAINGLRTSRSSTPNPYVSSHPSPPQPTPLSQTGVSRQLHGRSPTFLNATPNLQRSASTTSSTGSMPPQLPTRGVSPAVGSQGGDGLVMLATRAVESQALQSGTGTDSLPRFFGRPKSGDGTGQDGPDAVRDALAPDVQHSPSSEVGVVRPSAQRSPMVNMPPPKPLAIATGALTSNLQIDVEVTERDRRDSTSTTLVSPTASSLGLGEPRMRPPTPSTTVASSALIAHQAVFNASPAEQSMHSMTSVTPGMGSMTSSAGVSMSDIGSIVSSDIVATKRTRI